MQYVLETRGNSEVPVPDSGGEIDEVDVVTSMENGLMSNKRKQMRMYTFK